MELTLIRSATLKLNYGGRCILIDPAFSNKLTGPSFAGKSKNPLVDLPMKREEIMANVDEIIVSHIHSDHFDKAAQEYIDKNLPVICQKEEETAIKNMGFSNVTPIEDRLMLGNIELTRTFAKHGSGWVLDEMGTASGFVFKAKGEPTVYWPGDTVLCQEVLDVLEKEKPAVVITHSAGAVWGENIKILLDDKETIEICKLLPGSKVVAVHLDSYDHATVFRDTLREYAQMNQVSDSQLLIPEDGETLFF